MKKPYLFAGMVIFAVLTAHFGCVKGNPVGADISTLANTTLTVKVFDGTTPQTMVSVQAMDPSGAVFTGTTDSTGTYVFQAKLAGQWTVSVPTQTNFFLSSANVNVVAGTTGPSISFTAQGQQLIVAPVTSETYGITGANITYLITYSNSGNLAEPVSLVMTGPITSTGWVTNFNYPVLGSTTNTSQLNIIIPQGSYQQPTFTIQALRGDGTLLTSSSTRAIDRNYSVSSNYYVNSAPTTSTGGGTQYVTVTGNITLSTVNAGDNSTNWLCTLSGQLLDSGVGYGPMTLQYNACPIFSFLDSDGTFNGGGGYFISSYASCGTTQQNSFQILPGQLKPVTLVVNCGQTSGNTIYPCCSRFTNANGFVQLNAKFASAVATVQGSVTFGYNAGVIPVGAVFNLTN